MMPDHWEDLSTARSSLVHRLIRSRRGKPPTAKRYLFLYLATSGLTYLVPLICAVLCGAPLLNSPPGVLLPFFRDFNVAVMALVAIPLLLLLLAREPGLLREVLRDLSANRVIAPDLAEARRFVRKWERRYAWWNLSATVIGLTAALLVIVLMTWPITIELHGKTWETTGAALGHPNIAGWTFFVLQIGSFFFLLGFHAVRELAAISFLGDVATTFPPRINPLDPDQVGGLRGVSRAALHYQVPVAIIGINIGSMFGVMKILGIDFVGVYGVASLTAYFILAPLAFAGPLFPFRRCMANAKHEYSLHVSYAIRDTLDRSLEELQTTAGGDAALERIQKLQGLSATIAAFPEWPFDTRTLKRFLLMFLSPAASVLVSWLFGRVVGG